MENDSLTKVWICRAWPFRGGGACGFSYDEFGFQGVLVAEFGAGAVDALQEDFGSGPAHFAQGLANVVKRDSGRRRFDVVESDDGDIFGTWHPDSCKARIEPMAEISLKRTGGEFPVSKRAIPWWPCIRVGGKANRLRVRDQASVDGEANAARDALDVGPALFGIGTEFLSLDERDLAVPR